MMLCHLSAAQSKDETAIRQLLDVQADAWNAADIEGFMQTYWVSDDLQFLGSGGLTEGWQQTLGRYKQRYPDQQAMGHLSFDIIKLSKRSKKVYSMIGMYHLERDAMDNLSGYFLLLFQKIDGQWKIVADSTH